MIERSLQMDANGSINGGRGCIARPTDLPTENRRWIRHRMYYYYIFIYLNKILIIYFILYI